VEEKDIHDELASIRSMMERSSKFISLSGLSGILAGVYALIGAVIMYLAIQSTPAANSNSSLFESLSNLIVVFYTVFITAIVVLIASITTGIILSHRKAKRKGQSIWGKTSKALLIHMLIPLLTGGLLIVLFLYQGNLEFIVPAMLIFYGLALFSAANFTYSEVRFLGVLEIALGLIAACFPNYGLLFWALGFGVLHVIYGSVMYLKYDK
jgi:hypothetical protein